MGVVHSRSCQCSRCTGRHPWMYPGEVTIDENEGLGVILVLMLIPLYWVFYLYDEDGSRKEFVSSIYAVLCAVVWKIVLFIALVSAPIYLVLSTLEPVMMWCWDNLVQEYVPFMHFISDSFATTMLDVSMMIIAVVCGTLLAPKILLLGLYLCVGICLYLYQKLIGPINV